MANPFKPTAGKMPPILIGRQAIIDDFTRGLKNGAGAPERLMLITGQRGFGKTVMLTELGQIAAKNGWEVYSETASEGLVERLIAALNAPKTKIERVSVAPAVSIPGLANLQIGGIQMSRAQQTVTLRSAIETRLGKLPRGKGIAFTIDESQAASKEDLVSLATTLQHVIRDEDATDLPDEQKHGIALIFAALPKLVDDLVNEKVLTFLRRATREELGAIPIPEVRNAFISTVARSGKSIGVESAEKAAEATGGNPYLVQLVGYYMWEFSDVKSSQVIDDKDVDQGIRDGLSRYNEAVCAPAFYSLTTAQQEFLVAMAQDYPMPSHISTIAERTGKSASWADKYRASLIKSFAIKPAGVGEVAYAIPHFGEWLSRTIAPK